jgi:sialate O-acetylesterase
MRTFCIAFILSIFFLQTQARLTTARIFGDHMVLQRNQDIPVWGWSAKGSKVSVSLNGQKVTTRADDHGNWKVAFKPMEAGGPYLMTVISGKSKITYSDIMIGEVWLCSGQSNMEFALRNAFGYRSELKTAARMNIRHFKVPNKMSLEPEKDISGGQWMKADTNTIGDFTAVGYFFAKKISQQLHVTVGLINSSWGGTQVESWISKDALLKSTEMADAAKRLPADWDGVNKRLDKQLRDACYKPDEAKLTAGQLAAKPSAFFNSWLTGYAPGAWEWQTKLYSYRGEGFMERTIKLEDMYANRKSTLRLGQSDADMAIYINGKLINDGPLPSNFQLDLPAGTWKGGDNVLLINLRSQQKNPSWFGIGLMGQGNDLYVGFQDTSVNLGDNNWHNMPDLNKPYHFNYLPNNTGYVLYDAMIHPLIPYAIAGALWYQGEANVGRAFQYRTSFPLMITNWRNEWKREFPFYFVQLSSFGGLQGSDKGSEWAELRESQTMTLKLPKTGMAITTDIGNPVDVHPKDKADVGFRLAAKALTSTYNKTGFYESPRYSSADFKDGCAEVKFNYADSGLVVKDKYGYVKGFELAGADHKFYYAQAAIIDGNKVKVWCDQVRQPVSVRYAWTDSPIDANLFSKEGFPVAAFRSDDWKGLTEGRKFE